MATFVYNYIIIIIIIIFLNSNSRFRERDALAPPFSLVGDSLYCGKGGHFARCTHMLQEGAAGRGEGWVRSPACGASHPFPR